MEKMSLSKLTLEDSENLREPTLEDLEILRNAKLHSVIDYYKDIREVEQNIPYIPRGIPIRIYQLDSELVVYHPRTFRIPCDINCNLYTFQEYIKYVNNIIQFHEIIDNFGVDRDEYDFSFDRSKKYFAIMNAKIGSSSIRIVVNTVEDLPLILKSIGFSPKNKIAQSDD